MKRKYVMYAMIPAIALAITAGGVASAHGMFGFGGLSNLTPDQIATNQQNMFQREATLLGISVDDVKTAWAAGKSFQQLATDHGITADQLRQKMLDQRKQDMKTVLATLVTKGVITQAQADQRSAFIDQMTIQTNNGRSFGRHGMGMGMMGF